MAFKAAAAVVICASFGTGAQATINGSCSGYAQDPNALGTFNADGTIIRNEPLPVLNDGATVYAEADANSAKVMSLSFGERFFIVRFKDDFYQISSDTRLNVEKDTIGWVKGEDILCRNLPILNKDGIARKFYVRTKASFVDDEQGTIKPKAGPKSEECANINGRCRELSRFTLYFVFAMDEASERVLLMARPRNDGDARLIGWVSMKDGWLWDTRYGLRPKENLVFDEGKGEWAAGEERRACLYETLEKAEEFVGSDTCFVPILGGNRWFNYALRIPVFERVTHAGQDYFRVAMPTSGVGSEAADDVLSQVNGLDEAIKLLKNLGSLDVFFLLDGTQSMQPHIDSLTGGVEGTGILASIQDAFANDPRFDGVKVRYGYRVYRDWYASEYGIDEGVGEGMPFDSNCAPTDDELKLNQERFNAEVKQIDTQKSGNGPRDTDHEENLIMGLAIAADDMTPCSDNVKLLFVVGDTGYDLETQIERGTPLEGEDEVLGYMTQGFSTEDDPIIPFFIQVPKVQTGANYLEAYDKFTNQGKFFVQKIGEHFSVGLKGNPEINIGEHFYQMSDAGGDAGQEELVNYILDRVSKFGDQRPINEVIAELQGGTALVKIIDALSKSSGSKNSVPALRLAQIEKRICDELGKACQERVFNDVTEGYIPANGDVQTDIWVGGEEFRAWRSKLELIKDTSALSPKELSSVIVKMMVDGVKNSTGDLSPSEMRMPIADFLKLKHGLPTGEQTPLLNYSISDFIYSGDGSGSDGELIEICELYRVARWLERHREIFDAVDTTEVPVFTLEDSSQDCDMKHPTPELIMGDRKLFPEDTMSYRKAQLDDTIFWLPNKFLP
ncbi:hypothetical protein [Amylibacter marinus]|nr:hypothetical protein [Amylibacter marinus]